MKLGSMSVVENLFWMVSLGLVFNYSCIWWAIAFWLACRYAREDTHYLLYLHDLLKVQLASTSADKNDAILQVFVCLWVPSSADTNEQNLSLSRNHEFGLDNSYGTCFNTLTLFVISFYKYGFWCSFPFLMFPWSFWKPKMLEPEVWHPRYQFKIPLN
jgi:hypothetical protein